MIEGMQRALDVSFMEHVLVPIGGREFTLSPQSAPQLERVLNAIYDTEEVDVAPETAVEKKQPWGTVLVKNYGKSIPVLALMFGLNPKDAQGKEAVQHLTEFMVPKLAIRIYEEWRKVNDIDDFLLRTGKPLLHPDLVARLKEMRMQELTDAISESIAAVEAVPVTEAG
jgi:hypothetical protein